MTANRDAAGISRSQCRRGCAPRMPWHQRLANPPRFPLGTIHVAGYSHRHFPWPRCRQIPTPSERYPLRLPANAVARSATHQAWPCEKPRIPTLYRRKPTIATPSSSPILHEQCRTPCGRLVETAKYSQPSRCYPALTMTYLVTAPEPSTGYAACSPKSTPAWSVFSLTANIKALKAQRETITSQVGDMLEDFPASEVLDPACRESASRPQRRCRFPSVMDPTSHSLVI